MILFMSPHRTIIFLGFYVRVCASDCVQWMKTVRIKPGALTLCSLLCATQRKTLRLFYCGGYAVCRTNMAKSSHQLHNGQATWLRSKQHHRQREDVCMRSLYVYVCSYMQFIYNLRWTSVFGSLRACVCVPRGL